MYEEVENFEKEKTKKKFKIQWGPVGMWIMICGFFLILYVAYLNGRITAKERENQYYEGYWDGIVSTLIELKRRHIIDSTTEIDISKIYMNQDSLKKTSKYDYIHRPQDYENKRY